MRKIPFPQANNIQMLFDIFISIGDDGTSKYIIMNLCHLTDREARYYLDALEYMGLAQKHKMKYFLTNEGATLKKTPSGFLKTAFAIKVVEDPFLCELYDKKQLFTDRYELKRHIASRIAIREQLNDNTAMRRAGSILKWFEWIEQYKKPE